MSTEFVWRNQCPCGVAPDPGSHPEGGCVCKDDDAFRDQRRRDRSRATHKPVLFFERGQWWAICFGREDSWNVAALSWALRVAGGSHGL